jgi:hypothetical protein
MRTQLYHKLSTYAGLTALVSDRIYPQRVPKSDSTPYVVFDVLDNPAGYQQSGYNSFGTMTVEISSVGVTIAECASVRAQVFAALDEENAEWGDTGDKIQVHSCKKLFESDNFFLNDGSEDGIREITETYQINYTEA